MWYWLEQTVYSLGSLEFSFIPGVRVILRIQCWAVRNYASAAQVFYCVCVYVLLPGKSHGRRGLVGYSPWGRRSQTCLSYFTFTFHFHALEKEMATHSSVLAWRIPATGEPGGCRLWGCTELDTTEVTQQQMTCDVVCLFVCLLAICISSLLRCKNLLPNF